MADQFETEQRVIHCSGASIVYHLERKDVRNLNLRIKKDGSVWASASPDITSSRIDEFVLSKEAYIFSALKQFQTIEQYKAQPKQYVSGETFNILGHGLRLKVSQGCQNEVSSDGVLLTLIVKDPCVFDIRQRTVQRFLTKRCREVFGEILNERYPLFRKYGVSMPELHIREMETRWGSCSVKRGVITLNKRLLEAPRDCIEYVIVHELCHLIHPNHSKWFYEFLTMLMPDWKERKKALDEYAMYWL